MNPTKDIEKQIKNFNIVIDTEVNKKRYSNILQAFKKSKASEQPEMWTIIMRSRLIKYAAAAVIIVVVLIGINRFVSMDGASVAWGSLAEKVGNVYTCAYHGHTKTKSSFQEASFESKYYFSSGHGWYQETYSDGKISTKIYTLPAEKVSIFIMPEMKNYQRLLFTDEYVSDDMKKNDPRIIVQQFMMLDYTELGRDTIDGIEVEGIETNDPKYYGGLYESFWGRIWVDIKTNLPVRIEMEGKWGDVDGWQTFFHVMDEFEWNVELESSIFEPNIPADYTLMAEMKTPGRDEESAIQGLSLFSKISRGRYPSSIIPMKVTSEVFDIVVGGSDSDPNRIYREGEYEKEVQEYSKKSMVVQAVCYFYAELVKADKDPAYYGDSVTAKDKDAVLMRWKISDSEYRVIFGDLTTKNISAEELAELEAWLQE